MIAPTADLVRAFFAHMTREFSVALSPKESAIEMLAVSAALSQMGVMDGKKFLREYATTLGRRVYLPFSPGVEAPGWGLWTQMVVFAHECQHVVQYDRLGAARFARDYVLSSSGRAKLEAEAYRTHQELHHWRYGTVPDAHAYASLLRAYGCNDADVAFADQYLRLSGVSVQAGAVINRASGAAISWLRTNAPDLRDV